MLHFHQNKNVTRAMNGIKVPVEKTVKRCRSKSTKSFQSLESSQIQILGQQYLPRTISYKMKSNRAINRAIA